LACIPEAGPRVGVWSTSVCAFTGCTTDDDCPVFTSTSCDTTSGGCGAGETCVAHKSGTTKGRCAKPAGDCEIYSGICGFKPPELSNSQARVGDPCADDTECDEYMICMMEYDASFIEKAEGMICTENDECCSGTCKEGACTAGLCPIKFRNGYCTIRGCTFADTLPERACPRGSACNNLWIGGLCQKLCDVNVPGDCRGSEAGDQFGDYECRAWNRMDLAGLTVASAPVCDFGTAIRCTLLESKGGCPLVGDVNNSTQMLCRSLDNEVLSDNDPLGYCLDTTASGQ
jgi:hypothetical protein